ncbi:MAG: non-ribosomal peptide synthase, partial [Synechococcales cyanobacterium M58_A2018_015]|nr:non-ribosomal peptide synthase [Synechococcales cyanobacterium M58_A2018_015]
ELPLTPNGKLDRTALPAPVAEPTTSAILPQTAAEQTLATIWQEVLQLDRVGITDNFFDLGGDSLKLIKVHSQIRQQFPVDISVIDLFRYPTISSLASYLSQADAPSSVLPEHRQAQMAAGKERLKQRRAILESFKPPIP